jgi:hypothetical protein
MRPAPLRWAWLLLPALAGCVERLTTPGQCPDLCPGSQLEVRDTLLPVRAGSDSSFFGYLPRAARTSLLVSAGLPVADARAFVVFPKQSTDSIVVDGVRVAFTVDTVAISFRLLARDSTATGLKVFFHRIPITVDTTATFAGLDALLTPASILDSVAVPDSVRTGTVEAVLTGDELARLAAAPQDSGRVGIGLTVRASKATGVRFAVDLLGTAGAPLFQSRGRVEVTDTAKRRQRTEVRPDDPAHVGYVVSRDLSTTADPDLLYIGGPQAGRALLRFDLPARIRDSAQLLRVTLELTPAGTLAGLPNNPVGDSLVAQAVVADLGAKSPPFTALGLRPAGRVFEGTTQPVAIDLLVLARQWQAENGPPPVLFVAHLGEGNSFMQPVFHSSRSSVAGPRLRVTYALPTRPGQP